MVASPGTGALFAIAAGLARGRRASVVAAFGCTLGILPRMAAGTSPIGSTSAVETHWFVDNRGAGALASGRERAPG